MNKTSPGGSIMFEPFAPRPTSQVAYVEGWPASEEDYEDASLLVCSPLADFSVVISASSELWDDEKLAKIVEKMDVLEEQRLARQAMTYPTINSDYEEDWESYWKEERRRPDKSMFRRFFRPYTHPSSADTWDAEKKVWSRRILWLGGGLFLSLILPVISLMVCVFSYYLPKHDWISWVSLHYGLLLLQSVFMAFLGTVIFAPFLRYACRRSDWLTKSSSEKLKFAHDPIEGDVPVLLGDVECKS